MNRTMRDVLNAMGKYTHQNREIFYKEICNKGYGYQEVYEKQ